MKRSIRTMFVLLAVVMSFVAVQAVWAKTCNVEVFGTVDEIYYEENAISVDGTTVYGIPLAYLANKLGIELQATTISPDVGEVVGDYVEITAHQCPFIEDNLSACTLEVNHGDVIDLKGL